MHMLAAGVFKMFSPAGIQIKVRFQISKISHLTGYGLRDSFESSYPPLISEECSRYEIICWLLLCCLLL